MLLHTAPLYRTHPREEGHDLLYLESNSCICVHCHSLGTEIASLLGVSRMTAYTRRQQFGLLNDPSVEINNAELQIVLSQLRRTFPESGEKMVVGHLRSL